MSPSRILGEEVKKLNDLAEKSLAIQILDYEAYGPKIQQIFQGGDDVLLCAYHYVHSTKVTYIQIGRFQFEMAISIQQTASKIRDDTKVKKQVSLLVRD